eukprot:1009645-Prymnesium_polylepis.1
MVSASTLTMTSSRCSTASKSSTSTSSSSARSPLRRSWQVGVSTPAPVCRTSAAIGASDDAAKRHRAPSI